MRIPLDYYQILGVPESDLSGLEQAYQDRLLQLPQQEYSDAAIESRKRLITVAYEILSDPIGRDEYAAAQRALTVEPSSAERADRSSVALYRRPELDIATEHFLGGLLILFELGEYEEINSICMPYLGNNGRGSNSGSLHPQPPISISPSGNLRPDPLAKIGPLPLNKLKHTATGSQIIPLKPDIVLAMVSSFWQLGEREWRDGCHEEAVIHYETAKKILTQEDLFPQIQGEIDRKLDRLRPYRISSSISLSLDRHDLRRQGIQFLEELLESACMNEVKCQERFALNSESTIAFVHENLPYLTAAEQRNLFSQLARDSHQLGSKALNVMQLACTYLHVHALIAQGFAYRNPQSIYTAQQILQYRLSQRIDVTLEQAICALLLGQLEEANQILATAPESAPLIVIRQQSQGENDLLRGLLWYVESWLKDEAFPCFRDLAASDPSLDAYFNDRDVQDFADRVPVNDARTAGWATSTPKLIDVPPSGNLAATAQLAESDTAAARVERSLIAKSVRGDRLPNPASTLPSDRWGVNNINPAIRVEQTPPEPPPIITITAEEPDPTKVIYLESERIRRRSAPTARTIDGQLERFELEDRQQIPLPLDASSQLVPAVKPGQLMATRTSVRTRRTRRSPNIPRILLVGTGGVTCVWGAVWLATTAVGILTKSPATTGSITSAPTPRVPQNPNFTKPTAPDVTPVATATAALTPDIAQATISKWLSAKASSLDRNPQVDRLSEILAEPALSKATDRARTAKAEGVYWQYKHQNPEIASIDRANPTADTATVTARVREDAQFYQGDRLDPSRSYSKQLVVKYNLVHQKNGWYIKDMGVVK
ncbi:IMS domain-containing protein [Chamaesiphon sp. GL140_3_metabinner_50]|uniref:IMS domain-containing protein n=1 Tax=Chamaesiphon sp. GL140_3_metabinner_50 TaxID=2970812 RepID=UPI0025D150B5|nr:IMS domain-containing protein [Chamaesiphon sp. GL140_3_metabinner_50]